MKGNKKILIVAVLLFLIAISYSTYAIYKTSTSADATVTAATWSVDFKDSSSQVLTQNITFTGAECTNNHVAEGKIAPGATCTKTIILDATSTEVDVTYTATAGNATVTGQSAAAADANQFTVSLTPASGTIPYYVSNQAADAQKATLTLTVTWGGTDNDTAASGATYSVNAADTLLQGSTITVPVTLVASQVPVA